jgi:hypothetical protein
MITRRTGSRVSRYGQNRWTGNRCIFKVCGIPVRLGQMDWITGSGVIGSVDPEGDGGILVDKQGSSACEPVRLEYPLLACA